MLELWKEVSRIRDTLKRCPFCGGKAYLEIYSSEDKCPYDIEIGKGSLEFLAADEDPALESFRVHCEDCEASTDAYKKPEEAVDAWNTRH